MSLKDIELKCSYDSDEDFILKDFYIPALSESIFYKRLAGFFTSNSLAIAARGMSKFILNGGKIQLICNVILSKEDFEKIKEVTEKPLLVDKLENEFILSLDKLENEMVRNHVEMLGWMLKNNKLEIKISLIPEDTGIQHQKTGILEDKEGNIISFSGSDNETKKGWLDNIENFHVFCSWREGDEEHLKADIRRFDKFWNDRGKRSKIFSISEAVKNRLIKVAPKNEDEFKRLSEKTTKELLKSYEEKIKKIKENGSIKEKYKKLELRGYQEVAVDNWFNNNKKGFFRMATGTGKTETAIGVIQRLLKEESLFVVIAVNGASLLRQWIKKLRGYGYYSDGASSESEFSKWREDFRIAAMNVTLGYEKYRIFVTTFQTFSSEDFIEIVNSIESKILLICDEVHHLGARKLRRGLIERYDYRLGLSATPERWFDEEGTSFLNKYFNKTVYTFSMKKAINEHYLCPYKYYPILTNLTAEEGEKFIELTRRISKVFYSLGKLDLDDEKLKSLIIKRSEIKKNAEIKMIELDKLFGEIGDSLEHCIIYCSERQMEHVKELLQKYNRVYSEFTQHQDPKLREELIEGFEKGRENGGWDVLLAIACLNEGIDAPSARIGIFLENSLNPIEFIQRRGRLLRNSENKKEAVIYDFIVETFLDKENEKYKEIEKKEIQKEFDRFIEFARLSSNTQDSLKKMERIIKEYDLIINVIEEDIL